METSDLVWTAVAYWLPASTVRLLWQFATRSVVAAFLWVGGAPCATAQPIRESIRLGTAGAGGAYMEAGRSIQAAVGDAAPLQLVATEGSVDNVRRLLDGDLDLAIVQNDVAFAAERGADPFTESTDRLRAVLMLHAEPVYLFTSLPVVRWLRPPLPHRIGVGAPGSGLFFDARLLLQATDTWDPLLARPVASVDLARALADGDIALGFTNSITQPLAAAVAAGRVAPVSIPADRLDTIVRTYPFFERVTRAVGADSVQTVAVRAMLVARDDVPTSAIAAITRALLADSTLLRLGADAPAANMPLGLWHPAAEKTLRTRGLLAPRGWSQLVSAALIALTAVVLAYGLAMLLLYGFGGRGLHLVGRRSAWIQAVRRTNRFLVGHKYALVVIVVAALFVVDVAVVQWLERDWAIRNGAASAFEQRGVAGNLLWMFVFTVSGYDDNLFPQSDGGKLLITAFNLIGVSGALAVMGLLARDHIKDLVLSARGHTNTTMQDHVIVCGWNPHVPDLLRSLVHANLEAPRHVVVLAETDDELPLVTHGIDHPAVSFCRGCATRRSDLDRAGFAGADTAIIVADERSTDPDAKTILKILTLESYSKELERDGESRFGRNNIYTIAELVDSQSYHAFASDARVDEVVPVGHIRTQILAQSALNHGVSSYLSTILTFDEDNDVYSHVVAENTRFVGLTFDDLLPLLRRHHVLLLAIRVGETLPGAKRRIISNPIDADEDAYGVAAGDQLIVLAQNAACLRDAARALAA